MRKEISQYLEENGGEWAAVVFFLFFFLMVDIGVMLYLEMSL